MKFNPKVSIIIPVFNGANYLEEAIETALGQTYKNIEVIVINDGSTDKGKTEEIARKYIPRITYHSKENGGVSTALNLGIKLMTGDYFSWLSHDDLYRSNKIQKQIDLLSSTEKPGRTIIYSDYSVEYVATKKTIDISLKKTNPAFFRCQVAIENNLHGCTMLVPKAAFIECGMFNESLRAVQDYDMWFRLGKKYTFMHLANNLVIGRVHSEQVGARMKGRVNEESIEFRKKCINDLTAHEIIAFTGKNLSSSYADFTGIFLKRKLYTVSAHTLTLSFKSLKYSKLAGKLLWPIDISKVLLASGTAIIYRHIRRLIN